MVGLLCRIQICHVLDDSNDSIIALIAGGIVGGFQVFLRAYLGTSEVIVTIMMNYIVLYVGNAFIHAFPKDFMQSTDSTFVLVPMQPIRHLG